MWTTHRLISVDERFSMSLPETTPALLTSMVGVKPCEIYVGNGQYISHTDVNRSEVSPTSETMVRAAETTAS